MKTSKQDIHDLLAAIANDVDEIKAQLSGTAGTDAAEEANAISNDAVVGNGMANAKPDQTIADVKRLLEQIAQTCGKLPDRIKSYHAQLLLRIPKDLREELTRDNDTRKRKGQPTVEDKIDNSLTLLISIYDRLNQIEYALRPNTPKLGIIAWLKSAWSGVRHFRAQRPNRWYRNPYILCAIIICLLYFALSIFSWQQWHYYRDENTHLHLTADKYRVDSIILRELYPQAAITISAYEHLTEAEGADKALQTFRENIKDVQAIKKPLE